MAEFDIHLTNGTIDTNGFIIGPGFVDFHGHYDAQIRRHPWCTISGWHGVTSVVVGIFWYCVRRKSSSSVAIVLK